MAVEQGMTVDQDARWLEIKAMSDSIAYRDDPPTSLESALCGAVWRARILERDRAELMEALREAIPNIGRFDFNPVRCPHEQTHTFGSGQSGFTINDNQEAGMVRCHTCGHRWQSIKPNEVAEKCRALLARLEGK